ncbi:hypothetical protein ACR6C2_03740 [Streptomyces sp. INA 01156]
MFRWTLDAWDAARALGMKVQVNTTVARHNLHDLPDIVRLVAEHGAMLWSAFFLVPTGRGRALGALTPGEVEDVLNFVYDMGLTVPAKTTEAHHFRRVALQRLILARRGEDHVGALGLGPLIANCSAVPQCWGWTPECAGRAAHRWTSTRAAGSSSSRTPAACTPAASSRRAPALCARRR